MGLGSMFTPYISIKYSDTIVMKELHHSTLLLSMWKSVT